MRKKIVLLTILLSMAMAIATLTACAPVALQSSNISVEVAPFPDPKPGSWWILKALDGGWTALLELRRVENGKFIVLLNGRETEYTNEWNATENVVDQRVIRARFLPHDYSFSFPLWEGKQWRGIVAWSAQSRGSGLMTQGTFSVHGEAKGWKKVEVAAGKFEAIRATIQTEKILVTCWYAPEVQFTAKCVSPTHPRRSWELTKFYLALAEPRE